MAKTLALFDFDGTITIDDSLLKFIRFMVGDFKFVLGLLILSPILVAFKLKTIPNHMAKQKMLTWFFKGYTEQYFRQEAREYSLRHIEKILRPKAMARLRWHKSAGHKVVIVSASLECWLKPWCDQNGFELLATQLAIENGRVTGKLASHNCHGEEKVIRIKAALDLAEFATIYAYGDTSGDKPMLALANHAFYKPFR